MKRLRQCALWLLLMAPIMAGAGLEAFDFGGAVTEARYTQLIAELRCLVCQNQTLADSDADLAHDLRREVYDLMQAGRSDAQIVEFLVQRYGDFVLYSPPLRPATYMLWYGPVLLLLCGAWLLRRTLRQRQQLNAAEVTVAERTRLQQLLTDSMRDRGKSS